MKGCNMNQKILRLKTVQDWTGLSRSTIYAMLKAGNFPKSVKLGLRSVGWFEADIQSWINSRQASKAVQT
jgi:prophage regulatory protein